MVETGTSVARRSPLPSAAEVRQWVGDCVDGFLTTLVFSPARKTGVVIMVNTDHAPMVDIKNTAFRAALGED